MLSFAKRSEAGCATEPPNRKSGSGRVAARPVAPFLDVFLGTSGTPRKRPKMRVAAAESAPLILGSTKYRKMQRHHETSKKDIEKDRKI